jgi:hypothetical protein
MFWKKKEPSELSTPWGATAPWAQWGSGKPTLSSEMSSEMSSAWSTPVAGPSMSVTILHPSTSHGFAVTLNGLHDNFDLHDLIVEHLTGATDGLIPRAQPVRRGYGVFNLWNWTAAQPDGTLSADAMSTDHWIWNEGTPTDIREHNGQRIVLLGPPPYPRAWNVCEHGEPAAPRFIVDAIMAEVEVDALMLVLGRDALAYR